MTKKTIHCDACGAPAVEIRYNYRRETDGAGSMETTYDTIDLCHTHSIKALQEFLQAPPSALLSTEKENFARTVKTYKWKPTGISNDEVRS